ncbi:MAG: hypothetical protein AB7L66_04600 [Gemmatimonadales bacterium]
MLKKTLAVLVGLILVTSVGAAYSRSRGVAVPLLGAKPLAEVIDRGLAPRDSLALAEFARSRCRLLSGTDRQHCYEEILLATVERGEVRLAMDALSVLSRLDPAINRHGHDYTHVVGINAWVPGKDVGTVYESCTGLFQSGCYHGVVQAYLDATGTDSTTVYGLCNNMVVTNTNMWLRFQCAHGIGHGLVASFTMNLPRALAGCDWMVNDWDAQSCYGGAFMEFIVGGRGQSHHPAKRAVAAAGASEHAGHDEHGAEAAAHDHEVPAEFAVRDRSDPLYPCSAINTRYQVACYMMQAGIIIEIVGADFGKISHACDDAPVAMQAACYQGVGTYVSGYTVRDPAKSIEFCGLGDKTLQTWCYVGVVKNFVDVTASADDALAFCQRLAGERRYAVACYHAIGEEMGVLYKEPAQREAQCARSPAEYADACRFGALLPAERPKELLSFMPSDS